MKISHLLGIFLLFTLSCNSQHKKNNMAEKKHQYTNALVNETSPPLPRGRFARRVFGIWPTISTARYR